MKHLLVLIWLIIFIPDSYGSKFFSVLEDYDPDKHKLAPYKPSDGFRDIIAYLDSDPASPNHLENYLNSINKEDKLIDLQKAGEHLLNLLIPRPEVPSVWYYGKWADSRALHLLHFIYLLKPKLNWWLPYYYAKALVLFPGIARDKYDIKDPYSHAFRIYDLWLREVREKVDFNDLVEEHGQDIPLVTIENSSQPQEILEYERAHQTFFAILSLKMIGVHEMDERSLMKGLVKYNFDSNLEEPDSKRKKPMAFKSWLDDYAFVVFAAGAMLAPVMLSHHGGEAFHHK